jgi:lysyl-tRNA synthetase class 2
LLYAVRTFFHERDFWEVDTPVCLTTPAIELHIDAEPAGPGFLRTSPEFHMKRLLAAGYERVFQIGPCFRQGEFGSRHHPEFTLLEWYRAEADYVDLLADAKMLILHAARAVLGKTSLRYRGQFIDLVPWERLLIRDAYLLHAGWDPVADYDGDRFDRDGLDHVEPALPPDVPTVLTDYPLEAAAFARRKADQPVAERWELFIGGLELANAYSELTDPEEYLERFRRWNETRAGAGRPVYAVDERFAAALRRGLPRCAGIALGIDRLVMLFADAAGLDEVLLFREYPGTSDGATG